MIEVTQKRRIEFIDLAKGVCIILVICGHTGVSPQIPGIDAIRMPLYYILSGLFFKDYGSFTNLFKKKLNKLLIPFLFFYITAYLIFYLTNYFFPGLIKSAATGIFDVFCQRQYFNGPIWFLLSLFWANLIFCLISLSVKSETKRFLIVLCIGFVGAFLGQRGIFLPCVLDTSLTALPFFYFGYWLKKSNILYPNSLDKFNVLISLGLYGALWIFIYFFGEMKISFLHNKITGDYILILLFSSVGVLSLLLLCKSIKTLPIVVFFGRFSVIPLLTHHMVYRPLSVFVPESVPQKDIVVACITFLICLALIPVCRKLIPWFVAQKDLIK